MSMENYYNRRNGLCPEFRKGGGSCEPSDMGRIHRRFRMISLAEHACLVTFLKKLLSKLLAGIERYSDG